MIQWLSRLFGREQEQILFGGKPRSPQWRGIRAQFLEVHDTCEGCGTAAELEAHHIMAYHTNPELELSWSNLMPLCRTCHFHIGHLRDWGCINPNAKEDAKLYLERFREARKRKAV